MSWQDIASIVGIAAIMISGANWVVLLIAKGFWNLVIKKIEERLCKLEKMEEKSEAFRHKHEATVSSLVSLVETFKIDLDKRLDSFEQLILSRFDTAILKQKIENEKNAKS